MRATWRTALTTIALMMSVASARAETPAPIHDVVLLQGDSTETARWSSVIRLLEAVNLTVTTVRSPAGSKVALRRTLTSQEGPVVLVAFGLSGAIATEVVADPKISALVYVAALAPEGTQDGVGEDQGRSKKIFYAVAEQGTPIPLELQRFFAARVKAKTIVLERAETHPREIAGLILEAAGMKPAACGGAKDDGTAACAAPALPRSLAGGCKCTKTPLEDLTSP